MIVTGLAIVSRRVFGSANEGLKHINTYIKAIQNYTLNPKSKVFWAGAARVMTDNEQTYLCISDMQRSNAKLRHKIMSGVPDIVT